MVNYIIHLYTVTCYAIEDAVQIVTWVYYNLTLTIIYYAVSHLHSLQFYTPIFQSLIVFITHLK
jgi:hypothetical protein